MSYLNLPSSTMAFTSKGVISLWFRFSNDAVVAVTAYKANYQRPDFGDGALGPNIFGATIPLVTFGQKMMAHTYGSVAHPWPFPTGGVGALTFDHVQKADSPSEPSHLGLVLGKDGAINLKMKFQTATRATVQGLVHEATDIHWTLDPRQFSYQRWDTVADISFIMTEEPESFLIDPTFDIEPDKWHHLLVSFDLSTSIDVVATQTATATVEDTLRATVKSFCKVWYAFDDENKNGKDNIGTSWVPHDPNGIVTQGAKSAAFVYTPTPPDPYVTGGTERPEYHWEASPIPMTGGPVGLPASAEYVDTIYHCEMAEFQMWSDVTLDTGVTGNRRAFVDIVGNPVKPEGKVTPAEKLLGKKPEFMLHGNSNWQAGNNTGTLGIDADGKKIVSGQFTPVAGIEKYKPEPALKA